VSMQKFGLGVDF